MGDYRKNSTQLIYTDRLSPSSTLNSTPQNLKSASHSPPQTGPRRYLSRIASRNGRKLPNLSRNARFSEFLNCYRPEDSEDEISPSHNSAHGARRSQEIDRYLQAESHRLKRRFKTLVMGDEDLRDMFWKQARLTVAPFSGQDKAGLRHSARKTLLTLVESSLREANLTIGRDPLEMEGLQALDALMAQVDREEQHLDKAEDHVSKILLEINTTDQLLRTQHNTSFAELARQMGGLGQSTFFTCSCATEDGISSYLPRVFAPDFDPTRRDWFHLDTMRYGRMLREVDLERDGYSIQLLSPKLRGERRKWAHFLENTTCLIYVADLSIYDLDITYPQDNLLEDSMFLFETLANSRWFDNTPIVLILSNIAAFKKRLSVNPLTGFFPDYDGGEDADRALDFIQGRFLRGTGHRQDISTHRLECSEETVELVLQSLEKRVYRNKLEEVNSWAQQEA
ncbi:hypothetical protein S7711_00507 [Stachybotrys chartarum IBT 7711]|uniref:G protein alpha subunit n=1 Tax=Stachybotrys chartarum (strain CBS 109288 / IBT 7711) TaxID=1280523 RepID=A0A084ATJ7_STACB|nr:hypothetical protein S7711_00507 [Stachybotrys chartarum IBT 7711]KFA49632.1 hypothetical protein S40293_01401 [Stachybotrys chartarum IBT 40293]